MPQKMRDWSKNIVKPLVTVIATAAVTWYVAQPKPAVLVYSISTTTTGSDSTTRSIVPGLAIRIGDEPIAAIHTHTIDLTPHSGYAESATMAIHFATTPRFFGHDVEPPTSLHTFDCRTIDQGFQCQLKPLDPRHPQPFRIVIATDSPLPPTVITTSPDVEVKTTRQFFEENWTPEQILQKFYVFGFVIVVFGGYFALLSYLGRRSEKQVFDKIDKGFDEVRRNAYDQGRQERRDDPPAPSTPKE